MTHWSQYMPLVPSTSLATAQWIEVWAPCCGVLVSRYVTMYDKGYMRDREEGGARS